MTEKDDARSAGKRTAPAALRQTWERSTQDPSPVAALEASRALYRGLSSWQAALVAEALDHGATWEELGVALGTTRQAAWARFRRVVENDKEGTGTMKQQSDALLERLGEEVASVQARLKDLDHRWRAERKRLQEELRQAAQQVQHDRQALQKEMREATKSVREQIRQLRNPTP
jgi:hypothetical protein